MINYCYLFRTMIKPRFAHHPVTIHKLPKTPRLLLRGPETPRAAQHAPAERVAFRGESVEAIDLHLGRSPAVKLPGERYKSWTVDCIKC